MRWQVPGISFGMSYRGQVVMLDAWGIADIASQRAATPDATSYRCASITKTMAGTLVIHQCDDAPARDAEGGGGSVAPRRLDRQVSWLDTTAAAREGHQHPAPP